jgi:hypothetical protein
MECLEVKLRLPYFDIILAAEEVASGQVRLLGGMRPHVGRACLIGYPFKSNQILSGAFPRIL